MDTPIITIKSDGTIPGTKVFNEKGDEVTYHLKGIKWEISAGEPAGFATLQIVFSGIEAMRASVGAILSDNGDQVKRIVMRNGTTYEF